MNRGQSFGAILASGGAEGLAAYVWCQSDPDAFIKFENSLLEYCNSGHALMVPRANDLYAGQKAFFLGNNMCVRVVVGDINKNGISVRAIDYDDHFYVNLAQLRVGLPDDAYLQRPGYRQKLFLEGILWKGLPSKDKIDRFEEMLPKCPVVVKIMRKDNDRTYATIYAGQIDLRQPLMSTGMFAIEPFPDCVPPNRYTQVSERIMADTTPEIRDLAFKPPKPLAVGAPIHVLVTDASDGPFYFSIQKVDDLTLISDIADKMQRVDKILIKPPIFHGQICLAYCRTQSLYARALVTELKGNAINVNFVDYGTTEAIGSNEIFELPRSVLSLPILAHHFCLSHMNEARLNGDNQDLIAIFKEIVLNMKFLLKVEPSKEGCFQTCDLYRAEDNLNVKKTINGRLKLSKLKYTPGQLPAVGSVTEAWISHVESPNLFYVQINEETLQIQEILQGAAVKMADIAEEEILLNLPCFALFNDDKWYRAVIRKINGKNLEVFFVDYGNKHVVTTSGVKVISPKIVAAYSMLALPCTLGDKASLKGAELNTKLVALLNENDISIEVTGVDDEKLVVKVLKNGVDYFESPKFVPKSSTFNARPENVWDETSNMSYRSHRDFEDSYNKGYESRPKDTSNWRVERDQFQASDSFKNHEDGFRKSPRNNSRNEEIDGSRQRDESSGSWDRRNNARNEDSDGTKDYGKRQMNRDESSGPWDRRNNGENDHGGSRDRNENQRVENSGFRKRYDDDGGSGSRKFPRDSDRIDYKNRQDGQGGYQNGGENKFGESERPRRQPIRFDERVSAGEQFPEPSFAPEETADVIVTFYVSPECFYIQTQANQSAFLKMMEDIQAEYNNKFSFKKTEPPQESDVVIAKFMEDRLLYRGTVIATEPMSVRFTDYGNCVTIEDGRDIYPVKKTFAEMPSQAVKAMLRGVKPTSENWASEINDYFSKDLFKCTFHELKGDTWIVSLSYDGKDLASDLIAQNLVAADTGADISTPILVEPKPSDYEFSGIDTVLLPGQVLVGSVPYVFSSDTFFVHFKPDDVTKMESMIANYVAQQNILPLPSDEIQPHTLCLASLDAELKCRGNILQLESDNKASVQFIDYGDVDTLNYGDLFIIPEDLKEIPALVTECCIFANGNQATDEMHAQFKEECEQKSVILDVRSIQDDKVSAIIYDLNGEKQSVQMDLNDAPAEAPIPNLPLLTREMTAEFVDFGPESKILIRVDNINPPDLTHLYADVDGNEDVEIGRPCAVKTADGTWHRGKRVDQEQAYLVDTGKTVQFTVIRALLPEFRCQPAAVIQVTAPWLFSGPCRVSVERTEDGFLVEPLEKTALISHVESANEAYVSPPVVIDQLINISLGETVAGDRPTEKLFAARFPDDEQWYRAEFVDEETMTVRFVDYGNTSIVTEIASLPAHLQSIGPQAVAVRFEGELADTAFETLYGLLSDSTPLTLVKNEQGKLALNLNGQCLQTKLSGVLPLAVGDIVYISHSGGPELVYLQRGSDASILDNVAAVLNAADLQPVTDTNALVAAKYVFDEQWYRAQVNGDQVFFVDHGNTESLTELRELPVELKDIPPLAQCVALRLTCGFKWTDEVASMLSECIGTQFVLQDVSRFNNGYTVRLFTDDSEIGEKIITKVLDSSEVTTASVSDSDIEQNPEMGRLLSENIIDTLISSVYEEEEPDFDLGSPLKREDNAHETDSNIYYCDDEKLACELIQLENSPLESDAEDHKADSKIDCFDDEKLACEMVQLEISPLESEYYDDPEAVSDIDHCDDEKLPCELAQIENSPLESDATDHKADSKIDCCDDEELACELVQREMSPMESEYYDDPEAVSDIDCCDDEKLPCELVQLENSPLEIETNDHKVDSKIDCFDDEKLACKLAQLEISAMESEYYDPEAVSDIDYCDDEKLTCELVQLENSPLDSETNDHKVDSKIDCCDDEKLACELVALDPGLTEIKVEQDVEEIDGSANFQNLERIPEENTSEVTDIDIDDQIRTVDDDEDADDKLQETESMVCAEVYEVKDEPTEFDVSCEIIDHEKVMDEEESGCVAETLDLVVKRSLTENAEKKLANSSLDDKIVPGSICRGINFFDN